MKQFDKTLQEALEKFKILAALDLSRYALEAQSLGKSLREYLLESEIVTEKQILIVLSQSLHLEMIDLKKTTIDQAVLEKIPLKFAWYYKILPVKFDRNILTVASFLPLDLKKQDEIRLHLGFQIENVLTTENDLQDALKKSYGFASDTIDKIMTKDPRKGQAMVSVSEQWIEDLEKKSEDPTVAGLVNQIILEAYKKRATDIHIEPYREKVRFRYRIDGVLVDANLPDEAKHFLHPILSRIKIMANLSITEKRLPQDGSAMVRTKEQQLDLRVSTIPTPCGESMVLRILPSKVMLFSLERLGFNKTNVEQFKYLLKKPHGIIFITGPTGSGKTTTLYACLNDINLPNRKIITIEDPVEYEMDGITQVQVNPKVNFTFSTGLRSLLRHDPDIIMVGEVRDLETAEIAIRTALTGHLVFSTLHTNDAASGITRLIDMGVEPYLVASSVETFIAQRLVRINCPKCKEEDTSANQTVKEEIAKSLNLNSSEIIHIYRGRGCDYCNQTGYYGRMAIAEILVLNDSIRAAILEKPRSEYIKTIAMRQGLITLRQNGWKAVMDGLTTPDEIMNVTVKDEFVKIKTIETKPMTIAESPRIMNLPRELNMVKIKKPDVTKIQNEYESRSFQRTFEPVELRYRLTMEDPHQPKALIAYGVEYSALTEDLSAGGLRFVSKVLMTNGSILELRITPDATKKSIQCLAKVCRVEEDSLSNIYTIVCFYLDVNATDRETLNRFVESTLKKPEASPKVNDQASIKESAV
jgi:type II secretory ATPase GspE/PulE/Tfp pilus assembly ATPase PilB-like protein